MARRRFLLLGCVPLALLACKEPALGECLGAPGSLCLTVDNVESFPAGLRAVLEVRVGACDSVPPFPCQGGAPAGGVAGCKLSCQDVAVPDRFAGADGRFTAETDLSASPGAGQAGVRLYAAADKEGCLGQATQAFSESPAALPLSPRAAICPPRKKRCTGHVDCGGAAAAQLCDRGVCVDPAEGLCPQDMALIPAGALVLGNTGTATGKDAACRDGQGFVRHRVTRPFCMDRTEVTVARFRACVEKGCDAPTGAGCTYQAVGNDDLAVNCLTYAQAVAYCRSRSLAGNQGRLPTEAEWEWAAGRDPKRRYPWEDSAPADLCEYANGAGCDTSALKVRPPGQTPKGNSPSAPLVAWPGLPLVDLAGNVAEWVADAAQEGLHTYCQLTPLDDPLNPTGLSRIVRGGSFADLPATLYTYARNEYPMAAMMDLQLLQRAGVRCVINPPLPTP